MDVDFATQLPDDLLMLTDKMSMAVSLECRVPLLDQRLVELAAGMPGSLKMRGGELKHVMKRALEGVLPDSILHREKRGFGAPMGAWLRAELAPVLRDVLSRESVTRRGLLDPDAVERTIREHEQQKADRTDHLLALINLEIWCRLYLDGQSAAGVADRLQRDACRMKVLFVCHRVPFPPKRGGKIRPFNIIRHLHEQGHEVTVASLARRRRKRTRPRGWRSTAPSG